MLKVLNCVAHDHDLRLVGISALICALGCFTTTSMMARASEGPERAKVWLAFAAVVFGCSVWSLHFVAMLAFRSGLEIAYDLGLTALSIVVAAGGALAALLVWQAPISRPLRVATAGVLLGLAVTGMHYVGVVAMNFSGSLTFDRSYLAWSIVISILFSVVALTRATNLKTMSRRFEVAGWLSLAICGLHFTGMTAITVVPQFEEIAQGKALDRATLAFVVGSVSLAILLFSLAATMAEQHMSQRARHEALMRHLARHDALTDLPNRFNFQESLDLALDLAARQTSGLAVIYLDLDRFKAVNDVHGHAAGDALLVQVGKRIRAEIDPTATLARLGGDEFVIILASEPDNASIVALGVIDALKRAFQIEGKRIEIGVSIGVALYPKDGDDSKTLMRAADAAMYRVKQEGRGSLRFYEAAMNVQLKARLQLEQELIGAVERGEMVLHYQPIVNGRTGKVETFEALLQWNHPTRGIIPPAAFIPLAEQTGLIIQIGQWVIETACREAAGWRTAWRVSINVSPMQFRQPDLCDVVANAIQVNALIPARVVVEITEGVLIEDPSKAVATLNRLRNMGLRIALDDFGTGYSSLSYLQLFKFDKFKIDRSFVNKLGESDDALTLTRTIVNLGHNLGLQVTAEGVETQAQLAILISLGCDQIQGYLIAKPAPIEAFTAADQLRTMGLFEFDCLRLSA